MSRMRRHKPSDLLLLYTKFRVHKDYLKNAFVPLRKAFASLRKPNFPGGRRLWTGRTHPTELINVRVRLGRRHRHAGTFHIWLARRLAWEQLFREGGGLVDVFDIRDQVVEDYQSFTTSFVEPRDRRIAEYLQQVLESEKQWPDPWLSLNPSFASAGAICDAVAEGLLHPECASIFRIKEDITDHGTREIQLHRHQRDAMEVARTGCKLCAHYRHRFG